MRRACNKCANGFSVPPPLLSRLTAFICVHRHAHSRHTRTCTYAHSVRAFALTRTAGTLKDVETRNRLQLDSTSRPAGHKTWPRLKRIASSFSISLSLFLSLCFAFLPSHPLLASFSHPCGFAFYASPNCGLYTLATDERRKRTKKEEKFVY